MWKKGFDILQNIEDSQMLQSSTNRIQDKITEKTINQNVTPVSKEKDTPNDE
jgi:hypothetical protein